MKYPPVFFLHFCNHSVKSGMSQIIYGVQNGKRPAGSIIISLPTALYRGTNYETYGISISNVWDTFLAKGKTNSFGTERVSLHARSFIKRGPGQNNTNPTLNASGTTGNPQTQLMFTP